MGTVGLLISNLTSGLSWPHRLLLVVAGPVDGILTALFLDVVGVSTLSALVG
jgi:hypothetical protein